MKRVTAQSHLRKAGLGMRATVNREATEFHSQEKAVKRCGKGHPRQKQNPRPVGRKGLVMVTEASLAEVL